MPISVLKTLWGATKGFFMDGGPDGAIYGAGKSIVKQEVTGELKNTVEDAVEGKSEKQTEQDDKASLTKVNL